MKMLGIKVVIQDRYNNLECDSSSDVPRDSDLIYKEILSHAYSLYEDSVKKVEALLALSLFSPCRFDDRLSSSGNSHTRPPPTSSSPPAWQEEGIPTASSMEKHCSLFDSFFDDGLSSSMEKYCSLFDSFFDDGLSSSSNSYMRPPPPEKWMPTVSRMEKCSPLFSSLGFYDGLSSSSNSYMRPPPTLSSPLYTGNYGYKIYHRLYIMGMAFRRVLTTRRKYRFILLEWGWYFEEH